MREKNNLPELKPCPFCGGSAEYGGNFAMTWVECSYCNCAAWADRVSEEAISVVWNRRAETPLQAAAPEMLEVLKGYEHWEGQLVMSNEAWETGELPTLTQELYDGLMALQAKRNAVLAKAKGARA